MEPTETTRATTVDGHVYRFEQNYVEMGIGPYASTEQGSWQAYRDDVPAMCIEDAEHWRDIALGRA